MAKIYQNFGILAALAETASLLLIIQQKFKLFTIQKDHHERIIHLLTLITHLILPLLLVISKRFEGWNVGAVPNALCTLLLIIAVRCFSISLIFYPIVLFAVFFWVLHVLAVKHIFYFRLIEPKGTFHVGYKAFNYKDLPVSVFYPTDKPNGNRASYLPDSFPLDCLYILATLMGPFPRPIFNIMYDYLFKVKLFADLEAPLISPEKLASETGSAKFIPIVFSPGLGMHRNGYSSYCTEYASRGHIVVSLNHVEDIKDIFITKGDDAKRKYLAKRVSEVRGLLDSLQQGHLLSDLFKSQIPLAMEKTIMMGHSFGGATAVATALEDKRVNDTIILDPWLAVLTKDELAKKLHCNTLLIESDYWNAMAPLFEIRSRNQAFINAQRDNGKRAIYTIAKRSDHITFGDSAVLNAAYHKIFKLVKHIEEQRNMLTFIVDLTCSYIELSASVNSKDEKVDKFMQVIKTSPKLTYE